MPAQPFVITPQDYPSALDIVGERLTILASGEATGGYEIFLQQGPEGSGPPPHRGNPDLEKLAEVGARHGLELAI